MSFTARSADPFWNAQITAYQAARALGQTHEEALLALAAVPKPKPKAAPKTVVEDDFDYEAPLAQAFQEHEGAEGRAPRLVCDMCGGQDISCPHFYSEDQKAKVKKLTLPGAEPPDQIPAIFKQSPAPACQIADLVPPGGSDSDSEDEQILMSVMKEEQQEPTFVKEEQQEEGLLDFLPPGCHEEQWAREQEADEWPNLFGNGTTAGRSVRKWTLEAQLKHHADAIAGVWSHLNQPRFPVGLPELMERVYTPTSPDPLGGSRGLRIARFFE